MVLIGIEEMALLSLLVIVAFVAYTLRRQPRCPAPCGPGTT
jgi:hypothetical protein